MIGIVKDELSFIIFLLPGAIDRLAIVIKFDRATTNRFHPQVILTDRLPGGIHCHDIFGGYRLVGIAIKLNSASPCPQVGVIDPILLPAYFELG